MSDTVVKKLKKYVLYISLIFFGTLWIHLAYYYLYEWASSEPVAWGTVSEAIIWSFPHFNPLVPSNDHNTYINGLLYRSMMQYSTISESFESDLVSCDTENLLYITCSLENNLLWSNGSEITTEDIKATLWVISTTKVNPIIASLLENTTIETTKDSISFSNSSKDINFLQVLLQPILPASVIERLDTDNINGKFSEINGIYSGRFVLSSISQDETVGITKITLWRNEQYFDNNMYIEFLILNLFRDETHFLKNKNSFNIYNDKSSVIWESIPRLSAYQYTLSQFVTSFFNSENLSKSFREYISTKIDRDTIVSSLWDTIVSPAYNPFLSETKLDATSSEFNLVEYLEEKWYYKKNRLLLSAQAIRENTALLQKENIISGEAIVTPEPVETIKQETLDIIVSPYKDKYNFVSKDNILIEWRVDDGVEAVYINEYKLSGFTPWDSRFFYRLLESYDSITEWTNTYKVYFETEEEKTLVEEFIYVYDSDSDSLSKIQETFFDTPWLVDLSKEVESKAIEISEKTKEVEIDTSLSLWDIQNLDDAFYYNKDGEAFSLNLIYAQTDNVMASTVATLTSLLRNEGIQLQTQALDLGEITVNLRNESLEYDIMVLWINLWYFESNIFPYFHSSQVKNGYNISNYKDLSLDILLEELKSNNLSVTKREELEEKMLKEIYKESIIKVLYTPNIQLLVDKNIKNFSLPNFLPDSRHRYFPLLQSYLNEKRIIQSEEKTLWGFLKYLMTQLFW